MEQIGKEYLDAKFTALEAKIEANSEKIDRVDIALRGNGQPGLLTRIALVERESKPGTQSRIMMLETDTKSRTWRDRAVIAAALSVTGGVIVAIVGHIF